MFRCAPVVYGQGFAAVGPVDDAMSQKVSESVHQAQEEQHLADLAASTRQRQDAAPELNSSPVVCVARSTDLVEGPMQHADSTTLTPMLGMIGGHVGDQNPPSQRADVQSSRSEITASPSAQHSLPEANKSAELAGAASAEATASTAPAGRQDEQSAHSTPSSAPRFSNAPMHQAPGSRPVFGQRPKKASSLQGARQSSVGRFSSTQSSA